MGSGELWESMKTPRLAHTAQPKPKFLAQGSTVFPHFLLELFTGHSEIGDTFYFGI
jgi:hypothetical protein